MATSFLTPARTVLLIGDESLSVYKVSYNTVKLLDNVPWQAGEFEKTVAGLIRKDGKRKPVLILNDMTDQHFKGGQRLPRVGILDKKNVLKRKLQIAFPNYPICGALPVSQGKGDETGGGSGSGIKGGLYLFAAVPVSEQILKTLEAVKLSMVSVAGFALLPVESSDMVREISIKLAGKSRKASRWVVFVGQHQNGALRQVITRDGQLAMTRMTPVVDPEANPQVWANDVAQEFKATISYLSRFGYSSEEGTDVIVIAGREAGEALEPLIEIPCNYTSFSAPEAGRLLGVNIGLQDEAHYAEPLHVAWAGRKTKFILPMDSIEIEKIHKPRQMAAVVMFLLILTGGFLAWQFSGLMQTMVSTKSDLAVQKGVFVQVESEYEVELTRMNALGFDVKLIQGTIKTYEDFETKRMNLLPLFKEIGIALGDDLRLDSLSVDRITEDLGNNPNQINKPDRSHGAQMEAKLSLSFPPTIDIDVGIQSINEFERRLRNRLPTYEVSVTQQIGRPVYTESLKGVAERSDSDITTAEDYMAELIIRGPKE